MAADLRPVVETQGAFAHLSPRRVVLRTRAAAVDGGGQAQGDSGSTAGRHREDHQVGAEGDTSRAASGVVGVDVEVDGGGGGVGVREVGGRGAAVRGAGWGVQAMDVGCGARAYQIHEKTRMMADCMISVEGASLVRENTYVLGSAGNGSVQKYS